MELTFEFWDLFSMSDVTATMVLITGIGGALSCLRNLLAMATLF